MLTIHKAAKRGITENNWLLSKHSFSFGEYYDPDNMGFSLLRVINEDVVKPSEGFSTHAHANMEIISYVLEGALEHKDSLGTGSIIVPGDVQRMSAGAGIKHSEFNSSTTEPVHFLQIWILPEKQGIKPSYDQKNFASKRQAGAMTLVASKDGHAGSITVHSDVNMYVLDLAADQEFNYALPANRTAWLQAARGSLRVNGMKLEQGDGVAVSDENNLSFSALSKTEVLLFDLAVK